MNTELLRKQASSEETIPWLSRFCLQIVSDQFARIQLTEKKILGAAEHWSQWW